MDEIWKEIPENKNYLVSNLGRIQKIGDEKPFEPKNISKKLGVTVRDPRNNIRYRFSKKKIIALLFVNNPEKYKYVKLIDETQDITPSNLKWVKAPNSKKISLSKILELKEKKYPNIKIAETLNVSITSVRKYLRDAGYKNERKKKMKYITLTESDRLYLLDVIDKTHTLGKNLHYKLTTDLNVCKKLYKEI